MVKGIDKFKEAFAQFADNYVIIGGTACDIHEEANAQIPRATKDIDIILVVEALSHDYVSKFWDFVKEAAYQEKQVGEKGEKNRHQYYRFKNPMNPEYPTQIELFSRALDIIPLPEDVHITPIPTDEDLSSLSAILMDDDYYHFTIGHSSLEDGVHIANVESLIALKCKAYLEITEIKARGGQTDSKHINKHRNDVFRMIATLRPDMKFECPASICKDIADFCVMVQGSLPTPEVFKSAGLRNAKPEPMLNALRTMFIPI